jgi:hypothetical protein
VTFDKIDFYPEEEEEEEEEDCLITVSPFLIPFGYRSRN